MTDPIIAFFRSEVLTKLIEIFKPEGVILFGSRVQGTARDESDQDVIVISDEFIDIPQHERFPLVRKRIKVPYSIDYLCYTSDEFIRMKTRSSVLDSALSGPHQALIGAEADTASV